MLKKSVFLSFLIFFNLKIRATAENLIQTSTITYQIKYQDVSFFQKILVIILRFKYDFLSWEELTVKNEVAIDTDAKKMDFYSVSVWPDSQEKEKILQLTADSTSFLKIPEEKELKKEDAINILRLLNFLYNDIEGELKFNADDIFKNGGGSMHCFVSKQKKDGYYTIYIETQNKEEVSAKIQILISADTKYLEKISAKLKIGPTIILTKKPQ